MRNLYYDQSIADRTLAMNPSDEQMDIMLKNRFTVARAVSGLAESGFPGEAE